MKRFATLAGACATTLALAVPLAGTASAAGSEHPSGLDKQYLQTSMQGDLFEITGGRIALRLSHNPAVIRLARRLIHDHTKSYSDSVKLARRLGIKVEKDPTASQAWELHFITRFRGRTFDLAYTSLEIYDHRQDIHEAQDEVADGSAPAVIGNARQALPMLEKHAKLSEQAQRAVR